MRRLLREAMQAGAFGFTTTTSRNHVGYQGRPLACRNASRDETGRGRAMPCVMSAGGASK